MQPEGYSEKQLWKLLVEAVHGIPTYPHHKSYVRDVILRDSPDIDAEKLMIRLGITLGEALVILQGIKEEGT